MIKQTIDDDALIFKDVNPCSKCGSSKTNFWHCIVPVHSADDNVMAVYECCGKNHKHSILDPDLRAYGKNLKIAMSRAKKLWNKHNPKRRTKNACHRDD